MTAILQLALDFVALHRAYQIKATVGHEDVAPGRKVDPGPNWPWDKVEAALNEAGIGKNAS